MTASGTALFGGAAAVAILLGLAILAWLHAAPTGVNPARDALSTYGLGPYRAVYRVGAVACEGAPCC